MLGSVTDDVPEGVQVVPVSVLASTLQQTLREVFHSPLGGTGDAGSVGGHGRHELGVPGDQGVEADGFTLLEAVRHGMLPGRFGCVVGLSSSGESRTHSASRDQGYRPCLSLRCHGIPDTVSRWWGGHGFR